MKIAFGGDISLHNIRRYTNKPFEKMAEIFRDLHIILNLESVFLPENYQAAPMKKKTCLRQNEADISFLKNLSPFLLNLSNNHINDYGNFGAEYTKNLLNQNKLPFFGAGKEAEEHNIFCDENTKTVFFSYTTRSTDLSGGKMFNEKEFIGPKELTLEIAGRQMKKYENYKRIIILHWGHEQEIFPHPEQRSAAKTLVDSGADLVIGSHAHTIQGYEQHKNAYIFYSLGNFLFPHFYNSFKQAYYQEKTNRESIMPVFEVNGGIALEKILYLHVDKNFEMAPSEEKNFTELNKPFTLNDEAYKIFFNNYRKNFQKLRAQRRLFRITKKALLKVGLL